MTIKAIDFYRKIPRDLTEATLSRGGLSIIAAIILLFGMDLNVATTTSIVLDGSKDGDFQRIDCNMRFPEPSCGFTTALAEENFEEGATVLTEENFDSYAAMFPIFVVNFYAPWSYWSKRLKPSWEKAAIIIAERYNPDIDGRILLGKVDCEAHQNLCRKNHVIGYPSIFIFRKGHDIRAEHGHHDHEPYYGSQDTNSLVAAMEALVAPIDGRAHNLCTK